jgi:site-specific recombinase XerD
MGVKIRKSRGKLYLDIYEKGSRKWEATGLSVSSDPKQNKDVTRLAEIIRSKRETQLVSGEYGLLDPVEGRKSLYEYMAEFAKTTIKKHPMRRAVYYLGEYPGGRSIKLAEVTSAWIEKYREYLLRHKDIGATTAANYFRSIKQILNKAARENIIPRNPGTSIKHIPKPEPDRIFLNSEEVRVLSKTPVSGARGTEAKEEVKKAFLFACLTGLRVSDLKTLTWGNIEHTEKGAEIIKRQQKTQNKIYNPMSENAWKMINDNSIHNYTEPVFPWLSKAQGAYGNHLAKWGERAKLGKRVSWHVARRTFAIMALENGADIYTVSKLLGHKNIATTLVYLKMTDKLSRGAVDALPKIEIM